MRTVILGDRLWYVRGLQLIKANIGDTKTEGGIVYRLNENHRWVRDKDGAVEGQSSLFDLPTIADDEPTASDEDVSVAEAVARLQPLQGKAVAAMREAANRLIASYKTMSDEELDAIDGDGHFNDEGFIPVMERITAEAGLPDSDNVDTVWGDWETHLPEIYEAYTDLESQTIDAYFDETNRRVGGDEDDIEVDAVLQQIEPHVLESFQSAVKTSGVEHINSLGLQALGSMDAEAYVNDEILIPMLEHSLSESGISAEDAEDYLVDLEEYAPSLAKARDKATALIEKHIDRRTEKIYDMAQKVGDKAWADLEKEGLELIDDVETLDEWNHKKTQLGALHAQAVTSLESQMAAIGVDDPDEVQGYKALLDDTLTELLDQRSSDPEDWED